MSSQSASSVLRLFLLLTSLCLLTTSVQGFYYRRRINCAKYVFAPRCRGISAKRSMGTSSVDSYENKAEREVFSDVPSSGEDEVLQDYNYINEDRMLSQDDPRPAQTALIQLLSHYLRMRTPLTYQRFSGEQAQSPMSSDRGPQAAPGPDYADKGEGD